MRLGKVGAQAQRLAKARLGLGRTAEIPQGGAEIVVGVGIAGAQA